MHMLQVRKKGQRVKVVYTWGESIISVNLWIKCTLFYYLSLSMDCIEMSSYVIRADEEEDSAETKRTAL
ncbi:hypothetical protein VA208B3_37420 [Vibrio alginolyticus]|nr:hypothetical protein VA208B3_37420 [Vibrio alginolyticus]